MNKKNSIKVFVNDKMQKRYGYLLTEPVGRNFDPRFKPELDPKQMLAMGVFGGVYMRDCTKEFPKDWFTKAKFQKDGIYKHDPKINFFGVNASQPLSVWKKKGWLHPDDPRGWFQWYCRYFMGRRMEDDQRQIKRWVAMRRHIIQVKKNCKVGDVSCRPKQRQSILHWAYDSRKM
ncbi:MAG: hypothetical protein KBC81_00055 [Candidatus Pacebacteria bacterium]|nr:hypothetical protein [Candidatus Paceibacterota bacterium]